MKLLNISDEQIFNHHSKPVYYPKKGKKPICNILLRKSKINAQNLKINAQINGEMSFGYAPFNLLKINLMKYFNRVL